MPKMTVKHKIFVIVDDYSAPGLQPRSYDCIHVEPGVDINSSCRTNFSDKNYIKTLKYEGVVEFLLGDSVATHLLAS